MNYSKYFSDPRRLLSFVLNIVHSHIVPLKEIIDIWAACNRIENPGICESHRFKIVDTLCKFSEVAEKFLRLVIHYDKCTFMESVVNIRAEMATIYRLAEDVGIYFGSSTYWMYGDQAGPGDEAVPANELSYGKLIQMLTVAWKHLINAFDVSDQDDPPGYKYLGVCKCGDWFVKTLSNQMFCSKSCAQNVRYRRYADKKKKQNK